MIAIFESILPIFLIIVLGNLLRRTTLIDPAGWLGLEQISYWVLYPTLLFATILNADFSNLRIDSMLAALLVTVAVMAALVLATWPMFRQSGAATPGEFSSIFQTALRWNGFIALAVAQKIFPPEGSAVVALAMAVIIIPLNVMSVAVVSRFGNHQANWSKVLRETARNPLIIGVAAGILLRWLPGVLPALLCAVAYALGVRDTEIVYLALCGSVPTAMNGYMLARQLGGDAGLYAAVTTLQTVLAALTMPEVLALAAQLISG